MTMRVPFVSRSLLTGGRFPSALAVVGQAAGLSLLAPPLGAQTEYRDAEAGTPVRVEDAVPTERSALDLSLASLRFERLTGGARRGNLEPRLAFGVAPRAELSIRAPFAYRSDGVSPRAGSAGVGVSGMYAFNVETLRLPAVALAAEVFLPTGRFSEGLPAYAAKLAVTRSLPALRLHVNASYGRFGLREPGGASVDTSCVDGGPGCAPPPPPVDGPCLAGPTDPPLLRRVAGTRPQRAVARTTCAAGASARAAEQDTLYAFYHSRWLVGVGVDRTLPFRSAMLQADVYAERLHGIGRPTDGFAELGARVQLTPRVVVAAAVGRHFLGVGQSWFVNSGLTFVRAGPLLVRTPRPERGR
jgi:hypothetical protein